MAVVTLESEIERKVVSKARLVGGWYSWKITSPGRRGIPDRLFAHTDLERILFIEFKRPGGVLSGLQKATIENLRQAGAEVHVVYSVEEGLKVLGIEDEAA